jgi:hypothetical protein
VAIQRNVRVVLVFVFVPFPDAFLLNPRLDLNPIAIPGGADAVGLGGG